jgi:hypothetical protein
VSDWHRNRLSGDTSDTSIMLTWQRVQVRTMLSRELMETARLETREMAYEGLLMQLSAYVLGEKLPDNTVTQTGSVSVDYPETWWQHFKHQYCERWWMRALARRRPPKMLTRTATGTVTATWHHMTAYPWARYTHQVPPSLGLGYPVYLRWMEHERSGPMFR